YGYGIRTLIVNRYLTQARRRLGGACRTGACDAPLAGGAPRYSATLWFAGREPQRMVSCAPGPKGVPTQEAHRRCLGSLRGSSTLPQQFLDGLLAMQLAADQFFDGLQQHGVVLAGEADGGAGLAGAAGAADAVHV